MPRPARPAIYGTNAVRPAIGVLEVVEEVARVLKADESGGDLKIFYAYLVAYCKLIRDHLSRVQAFAPDTANELFPQILDQLQTGSYLGGDGDADGFQSFCLLWNTVRKLDDRRQKVMVIKTFFTGNASPEERDGIIQSLERYEDELRVSYPEDPSQWVQDDFSVQRKVHEPSYGICNAAQSIFKALTSCVDCACPIQHKFGARLSLGTYRKIEAPQDTTQPSDESENQLDFDMFLSMQHNWHEVCIHTPQEKVVQCAMDGGSTGNARKAAAQAKTHRVKNLCDPIAKISTLAARRLELRVTRGRLFKLRSEVSTSLIDKSREPVSLEHLLKGGSRSFTERTRKILAVMLSSAVLHLHDTPWLQDTWNSSHVLFFRTTSSAVPLRPFVQAPLSKLGESEKACEVPDHGSEDDDDGVDPDDIDPDDLDPDDLDPDDFMQHPCPILVMLAVMLMEVYFAVPFSVLAKRFDIELSPDNSASSKSALCIDADLVFRACRGEIPENSQFHRAVEACLDQSAWENEDGEKLDDQALREKIYMEVVLPLETELSQAYSSIALEDLDRFAQNLDLASWDQTIVEPSSESVERDHVVAPLAHSSLPDLHLTNSASSLDPRQTYSVSPIATYPYTPPPQSSHFSPAQGPYRIGRLDDPHWSMPNLAMPAVVPQFTSLPPPLSTEIDYQASRFFDDETIPESRARETCASYKIWKQRYSDVYDKFIDPEKLTAPSVRPVKIAVLDTGIDLTHPDMEARANTIKAKANWTNQRFKSLVQDKNGHGTFTAGLILDYMPDAELYVAKIADNKPSSPTMIAEAINHAVTTWQVDIISMSFGFPSRAIDGYAELEAALLNAYNHRVLLFAAASNSGGRLGRAFPARDPNVIAVHAVDANGNRSDFSPTASAEAVNLATVGEGVESAWPVHLCDEEKNPTLVSIRSGTSYATPILAGIAGFLLSYVRANLPDVADILKRRDKMEKLLRRVAMKGSNYEPRDGYHFVDLSLYADSMFGKAKEFIDGTIRDVLNE